VPLLRGMRKKIFSQRWQGGSAPLDWLIFFSIAAYIPDGLVWYARGVLTPLLHLSVATVIAHTQLPPKHRHRCLHFALVGYEIGHALLRGAPGGLADTPS
jgi:hypothetical protein